MFSLSLQSRIALGVCLVTAVAFIASIAFMPYPGSVALKALPICALMAVAWDNLAGGLRLAVLAALAFSALGDITLELGVFLLGLGAFLLAQLTYAGIFVSRRVFDATSCARAAGVVVMMAASSAAIWPHAGDMQLPVAFYMTAISLMGLAAAMHARPSAMLLAGAVIFMVSDSLIGYNRFVAPLPGARQWIMVTYYLAQVLLVCGVIRYASARTAQHHASR